MSLDFLRDIARLSRSKNGPLLAQEHLKGFGIALIVEEHLPKTFLDGAAFLNSEGRPVIGMTIRYDRIDNFWFVLMHELVHVWKHLGKDNDSIFDDLDPNPKIDDFEEEADRIAREALIPLKTWQDSEACHIPSAYAAEELAETLRIHPAVVAGRIRYETQNYRKLNQLVGSGQVRNLFKD